VRHVAAAGDGMRVAMVSEHASPLAMLGGVDAGGQNVHVGALSAAMARRGADVVVHTRRECPDIAPRVPLCPGVVVDHVDAGPPHPIPKDELPPYMDEFAERLVRRWMAWRPDVVHAHFWMSGRAALAAATRLGIPVVQTFHALGVVKRRHQGDADTSPPQRLAEERAILRRADHVVATCSDELAELVALGADPRRVTVVPCGADLDLFGTHQAPEPRPDGVHRLVSVGRLVERKGVADAIAALRHLPDTELVVAGGPPRRRLDDDEEVRRLRAVARDCGVEDRVDFRGCVSRERLPALIRSADLAVCVPWYEPFGIVPLEAMACGVPVIASAVGGLLDSVADGVTGVHVPPRCPEAIAAAARALLDDQQRRLAMGAAGARRVRIRYSWQRVAAATLDVYEMMLERPWVRSVAQ
jgi:D-inositol-3-phosphate glycosyltransferase